MGHDMINLPRFLLPIALAAASGLVAGTALAAEGGAGFYLLGSKGPGAALMPPGGIYFQNDFYYYSGSLGGNKKLPLGGKFVVGIDGQAAVEIPTVLWVLPENFLGGHVGLTMTVPIGWKNADVGATLTGPLLGRRGVGVSDDVFTYGDPLVGGMLGWDQGNFHWQVGTLVNIPIGDYQKGEISNMSFNHWGEDVFVAGTYFDPATGWDFSGVLGMTFNQENPATDYRTGNEFHFEGAISKQFNQQFSAGILGYYYDQVTGDTGEGAKLGPFKGRVAALGATIGWNFKFGEVPMASRIKYFHEFDANNRAQGDAIIATISFPLSISKPAE
jgi:hypothetical protein